MRTSPAAGAFLALVAAAPPLAAQQVRVRLGGVQAQYADAVRGAAGTLTTQFAWDQPRLRATLDASYSQFTSGPWALQSSGSLFGIRFVQPNVGLGIRVAGAGGYLKGGLWSGTGLAGPVAALVSGDWVYSSGLSAGAVRRIDRSALLTFAGNVQVRRDLGRWGLEADAALTRAGPWHYADASLGADFRVSAVTLGGVAGARSGNLGGRPWYQGRASVALARSATLEVAGGSYPRDLSGFIGGSFVSLGVWLRLGRQSRLAATSEMARRLASAP
ncbi:MAG: hypothetical protein B7Z72_11220, partial [Gemmatimonadetes bacterium 21-71-4]